MTRTDILQITVPGQITPQSAQAAKEGVAAALSGLSSAMPVDLRCDEGPPSVLSLQLCHAVCEAARAKGAVVALHDSLAPYLSTSSPTPAGVAR